MVDYREVMNSKNNATVSKGIQTGQSVYEEAEDIADENAGFKIVIDTENVANQVVGTAIGLGVTMFVRKVLITYGSD
jgi:hypothetical protein